MTLQVNSIRMSTHNNGVKHKALGNTKLNVFENNAEKNEDTFTSTIPVSEVKVEKAEKSNKKKWLIAAGVVVGAIAIGVAAAYFLKNRNSKIVGESIENLKQLDNFEVFKDLKMCKPLSMKEKEQAFSVLSQCDNKDIFLATLSGNKPMSLLSADFFNKDDASETLKSLKKLDLGKNFECVQAHFFNTPNSITSNMYFVNKKELLKTIKNNKDIYCSQLNLNQSSSIKKIYTSLFESAKINNNEIKDDLLGITLGFPRYDSMIFNLEHIANLKKDRTSDDFINKILQVLKSKDSPYKNLSPNRLKNLENAIKNINRKNLEDIAMKGSYRDGLYSFINYCDDAEELLRVGNNTASFKTLFGEIL